MSKTRKPEEVETESVFGWHNTYPWQATALAERLRDGARWPQSLLICGADGIGKRTLALNAARALLCDAPAADHIACGQCPSCHYVSQNQHPDLMLVEPVEYSDSGEIKRLDAIPVDAIRRLIAFMQVSDHRQRGKVAIIAPAEKLNPAAANALLKTLEEPPEGARLILVAHQWKRLPATILSRCQRWTAPYPDESSALEFLASQGVCDARALLAQAGGAPLRALAMNDENLLGLRRQWLAVLSEPQHLSPFAAAESWGGGNRDAVKMQFAQWLDVLISWVHDLARVRGGGVPRYYAEYQDVICRLTPALADTALFRYYQKLLRERRWLSHPLQPRLIAESLLSDYRALFIARR